MCACVCVHACMHVCVCMCVHTQERDLDGRAPKSSIGNVSGEESWMGGNNGTLTLSLVLFCVL